jgi:hypothetical protein
MDLGLNDEEKKLLAEGRLIDAIKAFRYRTNLDLVTAKRVVDAHRGLGGVPTYADSREILIQMPVRDLLAGLALQGLITREKEDGSSAYLLIGVNAEANRKELARDAVKIADALIDALRGGA